MTEDVGTVAHVRGVVSAGPYRLSFESESDGVEAIKRLVAYFLVSVMPRDGLDESLTSLHEIYEFNEENLRLALVEPSQVKHGPGTIRAIHERAPFAIGR